MKWDLIEVIPRDSLPMRLQHRQRDAQAAVYGCPMRSVLMIETDECLAVYTYGFDDKDAKLRFIKEGRKMVKHGGIPIEGV